MPTLRYRFQTFEFGKQDIHLRTLRNNQEFHDPEDEALKLGISSAMWPLFGVLWDSGLVLAHEMNSFDIKNKRILELGCGTALASLVLNQRGTDITATDFHPMTGGFLEYNTTLNQAKPIPFTRTSWDDAETDLGLFDLIIGSDVLYESEHINMLTHFIEQHAKPNSEVLLVDPGRGNHAKFSKKMVTLGYEHSQRKPLNDDFLSKPFKGQILHYTKTT